MWSLDLGTSNTAVCRWDAVAGKAVLVDLADVCRDPNEDDPMVAPRLVPTATHLLPGDDFWTTLGRLPVVSNLVFWGEEALIGRRAVEKNLASVSPAFVPTFKPFLGADSLRTLARVGKRTASARDVARIFLRELFAAVQRATGQRIREIVVTTPVDAYEGYRAELGHLLKKLGLFRVHFVDEPVAAAVGYGVSAASTRRLLVADFGGGTLHLALVAIEPRAAAQGTCTVVAKAGKALGGDRVDEWLLEEFCERLDYRIPENDVFWRRWMVQEARRVKEELFFRDSSEFLLVPPEEMRAFHARSGRPTTLSLVKADLTQILEKKGLYRVLAEMTTSVLAHARRSGIEVSDIDEVLMVGGSTLLPGVYAHFEGLFGRDRVRAWQPFEAVARGACALKGEGYEPSDYIVHDYAIVTYDRDTNDKQYQVVVPHGTRFPTPDDFWRRQLVPTCALGEPERMFKLVVCEIGRAVDGPQFGWDDEGGLHAMRREGDRLVVPLNERNPTLGFLEPPHPPSDKAPRLDVSFGVNADRWLCARVKDLKTNRLLMNGRPVVRLL